MQFPAQIHSELLPVKHHDYLEAVLDAFEAVSSNGSCAFLAGLEGDLLVEASRGEAAPAPGRHWGAAEFQLRPWEPLTPPWDPAAGSWIPIPIDHQGETLGWLLIRDGGGEPWVEPRLATLRALSRLASLTLGGWRFRRDMKEQLTRLSILVRIGHALASNLELDPLLETVHREVSRLFDTTNFFVALYRAPSPEWECPFQVDHGRRGLPRRFPVQEGLSGYIIRTGRALLFTTEESKREFNAREGLTPLGESSKSWMGVPLTVGDLVVGAMVIQNYDSEGVYLSEDLELFQTIASQLAVAVRNAQLYQDAARRAQETEALSAIGRDIMSSLDAKTVLARIATSVRNLLTEDSLAIFLENEEEECFEPVAASGPMTVPLKGLKVHRGSGILGAVIEQGRAEIINDTSEDPRAIHIAGSKEDEKGDKLMAAPLFSEDRVIGIIAAWRDAQELPFETVDLDFMEGIARQASVALRNAQLFGQSRTAQAEAETANRAKSAFLASMSHELRTPLNAILLYCELLMDEVHERGLGEFGSDLDKIQGAGRHLLGLIDDILDLSKIEAGRMSVYVEECDLAAVLMDVEATALSLMARNRNRFRMEVDPALRTLVTDQKKLRQMLYNLLSNAAKFTHDGTITLTVGQAPGDPRRISFVVADTGIGMTPEQLERVFQEFAQAEASTSRKYGGTGLGLALCRKFAVLLGGEIQVESEPGRGSTFRLLLPGLPLEPAMAAPQVARPAGQVRGRILLIDDDPALREALSRMLAREGFQVTLAGNGMEGLALARSLAPQLITLDIEMPGCDGWEVLARLKADPELKQIPVVVVSVLDERARGFALEAADYLQKPVDRERLLDTLESLLPDRQQIQVLVVEDDAATREGLVRILHGAGLHAQAAEGGLQALALLRQSRPGLILLDLMMPGMDGFQLMETLQGSVELRTIPVVVLTAMELTPEVRARLRMSQIHRIIGKGTYSRDELVDVIRRYALRNLGDSGEGGA